MARKSWWQRLMENKQKGTTARRDSTSSAPLIASFATRDPSQRLAVRASPSMHATNPPFLNANLDLGYLARELKLLRDHNLTFQQDDPQETMLMFSEGALVLITMERFLRTILGKHVGPGQTLPNLLELAFSDRIDALDPPGGDRALVTKLVTDIRNALLHANFEQAAQQSGCRDVRDYFRNRYARDLELLYRILDNMMSQIDPATGWRRETAERRRIARQRLHGVLVARRRSLQRRR